LPRGKKEKYFIMQRRKYFINYICYYECVLIKAEKSSQINKFCSFTSTK
jgi:hypothetical protein